MTTTRVQSNTKLLLLIILEAAILLGAYVNAPAICGFGIAYSRRLFVGCLLGALTGGFVFAVAEYPHAPWKFTQSVLISAIVSTWVGYGGLHLVAGLMKEAPQWPGMAVIYLCPASIILSAIAAILCSLCIPMHGLATLLQKNGKL